MPGIDGFRTRLKGRPQSLPATENSDSLFCPGEVLQQEERDRDDKTDPLPTIALQAEAAPEGKVL